MFSFASDDQYFISETIGNYKLDSIIASGSNVSVYTAKPRNSNTDPQVAVKLERDIPSHLALNKEIIILKKEQTPEDDLMEVVNIITQFYDDVDQLIKMKINRRLSELGNSDSHTKSPSIFNELTENILNFIPQAVPNYNILLLIIIKIANENLIDLNLPFEWELEIEQKSSILMQNYNRELQIKKQKAMQEVRRSAHFTETGQEKYDFSTSTMKAMIQSLPNLQKLRSQLSTPNLLQILPQIKKLTQIQQ
ncbi:MAG: hypothetical protein EZS28_018196, partial [Streblomastix strix]